jgi:hypothetical protein
MAQYLYHIGGKRYEIAKITPKLVFYYSSTNVMRTVPRDAVKSDSTAVLRFDWYLLPPSWPTEGELGEMYAELREREKARDAAFKAYRKARDYARIMQEAIDEYECTHAWVSA